jgi:hypothetical protein
VGALADCFRRRCGADVKEVARSVLSFWHCKSLHLRTPATAFPGPTSLHPHAIVPRSAPRYCDAVVKEVQYIQPAGAANLRCVYSTAPSTPAFGPRPPARPGGSSGCGRLTQAQRLPRPAVPRWAPSKTYPQNPAPKTIGAAHPARVALKDLEIGGCSIPAGAMIVVHWHVSGGSCYLQRSQTNMQRQAAA